MLASVAPSSGSALQVGKNAFVLKRPRLWDPLGSEDPTLRSAFLKCQKGYQSMLREFKQLAFLVSRLRVVRLVQPHTGWGL